ncbi:unnamed protein product [Withania somnifera]
MPTIKQLIRNTRQPIRNFTKSPALRGALKDRGTFSAHRDRDRKKRDFRRLWITRINAVIRERGISYSYNRREVLPYSYSRLIHDMYKKHLLLNRKILAQ